MVAEDVEIGCVKFGYIFGSIYAPSSEQDGVDGIEGESARVSVLFGPFLCACKLQGERWQ